MDRTPALSGAELRRDTFGSQIADAIRGDILFGRLRPGEPVNRTEVGEQFGTSPMPVRDALRQLTHQGFLVRKGGRSAVVAPLSRRDLDDIFHVQGILHGLAVRRVTETAGQDALDDLAARHEAMLDAERAGDLRLLAQLDRAFHRCFNVLADSRKLHAALATLQLRIPAEFVMALPGWTTGVNPEHAAMLDAVLRRDAHSAEQLMRRHITQAGARLRQALEAQGLELN